VADVHFVEQQTALELTADWARGWERAMLDEYSELLVTYRERVTEHWQDLAMQVPDAFPLAGPCEVVTSSPP
jgi:hypothetical protein